jgi:hypothetical protein
MPESPCTTILLSSGIFILMVQETVTKPDATVFATSSYPTFSLIHLRYLKDLSGGPAGNLKANWKLTGSRYTPMVSIYDISTFKAIMLPLNYSKSSPVGHYATS